MPGHRQVVPVLVPPLVISSIQEAPRPMFQKRIVCKYIKNNSLDWFRRRIGSPFQVISRTRTSKDSKQTSANGLEDGGTSGENGSPMTFQDGGPRFYIHFHPALRWVVS